MPTIICVVPFAMQLCIRDFSLAVPELVTSAIVMFKASQNGRILRKCCSARSSVGAISAV